MINEVILYNLRKGGDEKMVLNIRTIIATTLIAAVLLIMAGTALAKGKSGTTKPGWGYGDKNHVHTGPPGQSVRPSHSR